jgi:hypothetical protein
MHKDWKTWVVVVLMLIAIGTYVATLDDSTIPEAVAPPAATAP